MRSALLLFLVLSVFFDFLVASTLGLQNDESGNWITSEKNICRFNSRPNTSDITGADYVSNVRALKIPSGRTYRYVFYPARDKPYILFIHGFPSSSYDWRRQFQYFSERGYGIVAPDLLGYGGTDHPDIDAFRLKNMAQELVDLLDCLGIDTVLGVSHDFGSPLLSRVVIYFPERLISVSLLDIGYAAPPLALSYASIEKRNNQTLATLGYSISGYWLFLAEADAPSILGAHLESASTLIYTSNNTLPKLHLGTVGSFKTWLLANETTTLAPWISEEENQIHNRIIANNGGWAGLCDWYIAALTDINAADEALIPLSAKEIELPVLLITATKDPIGIPVNAINGTQPYAKNYRLRQIESGHFVQIESSEETNEALEEFFVEVLKNSTGHY